MKSNVMQQMLNLLKNKFIFSELGTSLNSTKGSINDMVLAGKAIDEDVFFTAAEPPLPSWERLEAINFEDLDETCHERKKSM